MRGTMSERSPRSARRTRFRIGRARQLLWRDSFSSAMISATVRHDGGGEQACFSLRVPRTAASGVPAARRVVAKRKIEEQPWHSFFWSHASTQAGAADASRAAHQRAKTYLIIRYSRLRPFPAPRSPIAAQSPPTHAQPAGHESAIRTQLVISRAPAARIRGQLQHQCHETKTTPDLESHPVRRSRAVGIPPHILRRREPNRSGPAGDCRREPGRQQGVHRVP